MRHYLRLGPVRRCALELEFEWLPLAESELLYLWWTAETFEGIWHRSAVLDVFRISFGVSLILFPSAAE